MKCTVYLLAILGFCLAQSSSEVLEPLYVVVEPIRKAVDLPGPRIIGGYEVEPNSVPYQVAVVINGNNLCGGSLISTTRVLSAAHCTVIAAFVELRFGSHYHNQNEPTQVRLTSTSFINHERYDGSTIENDISVILLPSPVAPTAAIQVVPLAPSTAPDFQGSPHGGAAACNSDSGGPLVADGVQVGVVSFSAPGCEVGLPTGFARVSAYRDWIRTNAEV
ncbi:chymotrypsin BII-like [Anoplophora glabripennis]|uniref:chymotrypsin BII-like n=1 Tax=Anoplophora glabripennis TaxID=217634 RepID=UPI0008747040|nr:chymotrypsin BII-like [Anoplophora glabripennis]